MRAKFLTATLNDELSWFLHLRPARRTSGTQDDWTTSSAFYSKIGQSPSILRDELTRISSVTDSLWMLNPWYLHLKLGIKWITKRDPSPTEIRFFTRFALLVWLDTIETMTSRTRSTEQSTHQVETSSCSFHTWCNTCTIIWTRVTNQYVSAEQWWNLQSSFILLMNSYHFEHARSRTQWTQSIRSMTSMDGHTCRSLRVNRPAQTMDQIRWYQDCRIGRLTYLCQLLILTSRIHFDYLFFFQSTKWVMIQPLHIYLQSSRKQMSRNNRHEGHHVEVN